jgi:outer membrane protein assembly factor BamB
MLSLASAAVAADWPRFMGADGTGVAEESEKVSHSWPSGGPKEMWKVAVRYGFGGPAIADGKVFLLDRQDDRDIFRVLDLKSGQTIWEQPYTTGKFRGGYSGSRSTPTIDGNRAYTVGVLGHVTCFDIAAKKPLWQKNLRNDFGAQSGDWGFAQSPLIVGDMVIVSAAGGSNGLVALDKNTGNTIWRTRPFGDTDCYTSPALIIIGGDDQIVMWHKGMLAGFNPKNGSPIWEYKWRTNRPIPQPVHVGDGKFFLTIGYGGGCAMIQVRKSPSVPWKVTEIFQDERSGSKVPPALFYRDHIYTTNNDQRGGLQCLDSNGDVKWDTGRRPTFGLGSLLIADGVLFIVHGDTGELVMAEASPAGYKELGRAKVLGGRDIWAPMALSDGRLVLRDHEQMKCVYVGSETAGD